MRRGRGLCGSLKLLSLPDVADAVKVQGDTPQCVGDVSIIVHQYEKKDNACPVGEYAGSNRWEDFYPEYNQVGTRDANAAGPGGPGGPPGPLGLAIV